MNFRSYHANIYTYLSKGVADYVAVWDFKEFFIPRGTHQNLRDLLTALESPTRPTPKSSSAVAVLEGAAGTRGMADIDHHPFCSLLLHTEVTYADRIRKEKNFVKTNPWLGQQFIGGSEPLSIRQGFESSIRPTRSFSPGGRTCRLPQGWVELKVDRRTHNLNFTLATAGTNNVTKTIDGVQSFDDSVTARDATEIKHDTEGVLSHLAFDKSLIPTTQRDGKIRGAYTIGHYPAVYEALEVRGLVMPIELPEVGSKPVIPIDAKWVEYEYFLEAIDRAVSASAVEENPLIDLGDSLDIDSRIYLKDILPTPYDASAEVQVNELPAFARDSSEVFLAGLLERTANSWDLHVTTFMMCHTLLTVYYPLSSLEEQKALKIRNTRETLLPWAKAIHAMKNMTYLDSGVRAESPRYFCRIRTTFRHEPYIVQGTLSPSSIQSVLQLHSECDANIFFCTSST